MKITTQLFYAYLNEHYLNIHLGQGFQSDDLPLPMFYSRGAEIKKGALYIVRTQDLPQNSNVDCLFLCAGNRPAHIGAVWRGEVLYIDRREAAAAGEDQGAGPAGHAGAAAVPAYVHRAAGYAGNKKAEGIGKAAKVHP